MLRQFVKLILFLIFLGVLIAVAAFWYLNQSWSKSLSFSDQIYTIEAGASIRKVSRQLYENQIMSDPYSFALLGMVEDKATQIKVGDYRLVDKMTARQLLEKFIKGEVITYKVALVEGWTFRQFREKIATVTELEHVTSQMSAEQIMGNIAGDTALHPEGQFFPDTYVFRTGDSDLDVLKQAYNRMHDSVDQAWENRHPNTPIKSKYDALILASIIEKETGQASERPTIGGVFTNRLNKGMLLQTDPTIIYGLGDSFNGNLTRAHLKDKNNIYNTYQHGGLPPTPIAMPGRDSIVAALSPEKTDHYYFVAKGDGSHKFSPTYKEHQRAVAEYQLKQKSKG